MVSKINFLVLRRPYSLELMRKINVNNLIQKFDTHDGIKIAKLMLLSNVSSIHATRSIQFCYVDRKVLASILAFKFANRFKTKNCSLQYRKVNIFECLVPIVFKYKIVFSSTILKISSQYEKFKPNQSWVQLYTP